MRHMLFECRRALQQVFSYPVEEIARQKVDYDAYWRDKRPGTLGLLSDWQKRRVDLAARCLMGAGNVSVVDIGSGDGAMLVYLREKLNITRAVAVDVSDVVLDKAREFGLETVKTDIALESGRAAVPSADFICMFEILEHVPDSEQLLNTMWERAHQGVLFSFPNTGYFVYRLRLLFGKFPAQWRIHPGEHLRFWTLRDLQWWMRAQGYEKYSVYTYKGVPILNRILPSLFAAAFFVHLEK